MSIYNYFRNILDSMQEEIMAINREWRITDVNAAFLRRLKLTREEAIGQKCYELISQREKPCGGNGFVCPLQSVLESGRLIHAFYLHHDPKGNKTYYNVVALPVFDSDGHIAQIIAVCQDVTAERQLEAKLRAIYALGRELVLSRDEVHIARAVVNAAEQVLEFQLCDLWLIDEESKNLICVAHVPLKELLIVSRLPLDGPRGVTVAVACSGEAIYLPDVSKDTRYVCGHPKTRSELCAPLKIGERVIGVLNAESERVDAFSKDDQRLLAVLADVAALGIENARLFEMTRQQHERLRTLAMRLAESEEAERRRLARELHDQVGQNLTVLGINLNFVRTQAAKGLPDEARSRLDESLMLIEQTVECIRNVMADLRPPVLDNHGVVAALRWYGAQIAARSGITVMVQGEEPVPRLASSVETALFRIAQEALTNVVKHAQATEVTIALEVHEATVCLVVADNGVGFGLPRSLDSIGHQGWGLLSMTERARAVGGNCYIDSHPGRGTQVVVEMPR